MEKNRGQGDHIQISRCFELQSDFVFNFLTDDDWRWVSAASELTSSILIIVWGGCFIFFPGSGDWTQGLRRLCNNSPTLWHAQLGRHWFTMSLQMRVVNKTTSKQESWSPSGPPAFDSALTHCAQWAAGARELSEDVHEKARACAIMFHIPGNLTVSAQSRHRLIQTSPCWSHMAPWFHCSVIVEAKQPRPHTIILRSSLRRSTYKAMDLLFAHSLKSPED